MRPVLIDTNAYVAFKKGESSVVEIIRYAETLAISPIVIGELLSGFECGIEPLSPKGERGSKSDIFFPKI